MSSSAASTQVKELHLYEELVQPKYSIKSPTSRLVQLPDDPDEWVPSSDSRSADFDIETRAFPLQEFLGKI
jgi:hypothetical protein